MTSYSAEELYDIVSDVDSYNQFVPYCTGSRVLGPSKSSEARRNDQGASKIVDAELTIGFSALRESYVSEVSMRPNEWAKAKPSPLFQELRTAWRFRPLPASPSASFPRTEVNFTLSFAFSNPLYATIAGQVFEKLSGSMIDAFRTRSESVYGRRR
ncbi:ubiquinone binding protein [Malassezia pachydermatis]